MSNVPAPMPTITLQSGGKAMAIVPQNWAETVQMAGAFVRAGMVPKHFEGNVEKVTVAILAGLEVGLGPLASVQNIYIVNNIPTLYGDALLALVRGSSLLEDISEFQEEDENGQCLVAVCRVKRKGEATWGEQVITAAFCAKAGWLNKPGPWTLTRKRMMQMRARGWALRDKFADVLKGLKPAEEMEDLLVDVTAQGSVTTTPPPPPKRSDFAEREPEAVEEAASASTSVVADSPETPATGADAMPAKSWAVNLAQPGEEPKRLAILELVNHIATTVDEVNEIVAEHREFLNKLGKTRAETRRAIDDRILIIQGHKTA